MHTQSPFNLPNPSFSVQAPAQQAPQTNPRGAALYNILQSQNDITAALIKQQQLSSLSPKDIKVFEGDLVEYRSFIRSFEHIIETKTDSAKDRLCYLEQYTRGRLEN